MNSAVTFTLELFTDSGLKQSPENACLTPVRSIAREQRNQRNICHRLGECQEFSWNFFQEKSQNLSYCRMGEEKHVRNFLDVE